MMKSFQLVLLVACAVLMMAGAIVMVDAQRPAFVPSLSGLLSGTSPENGPIPIRCVVAGQTVG